MKKYKIQVTETSSRIIEVTASDAEMAERIVMKMYQNEEVVLDYADYDYVDFNLIED